ncbi:hypothetical protein PS918_00647 [Pseudomonas fluorescens]|uniref:Type 1 fimbrial protein n=1 Tax=Pseudomonas fluorescens TaxID=294 RepID=A0A5E7R099_PSEFL|nr:hypothetical protein [Pseudomonas fluorescens]VVP67892.1 hypothetical protein PS918_00647 [Pseudomonas fluorescens]
MKITYLPVVISLFSTAGWAASPVVQNTIRFEGRVVERSCTAGGVAPSSFDSIPALRPAAPASSK